MDYCIMVCHVLAMLPVGEIGYAHTAPQQGVSHKRLREFVDIIESYALVCARVHA